MNINENSTKIILGIIGLIVAIVGVTWFSVKKNSHNKTTINQNNNSVSNGDIVAGNKTTKRESKNNK